MPVRPSHGYSRRDAGAFQTDQVERFPSQMVRDDRTAFQKAMQDTGKIGVVTSDDITSALLKTDAAVKGIDDAIASCPQLPAAGVEQWKDWKGGYDSFSAANKGLPYLTLGLANIGDQVVAYEDEIVKWQELLKQAGCLTMAPVFETHQTASDTGAPTVVTALEAGTALVVAGGIVYALTKLLPSRR